jgi:prepilin-type N-terminal cleavage/methylation domain-containing protein
MTHRENTVHYTGSSRGFSLIELLVVIGIIAIAAMIGFPLLNQYAINKNLRSAARDIVADIQTQKERAISENRRCRIIFNVAGNSYTLQRENDAGTAYVNLLDKTPASFSDDIRLTGANFSGGSTITFQTRGTSSFGNLSLENRRNYTAQITVNIAGRTNVSFSE